MKRRKNLAVLASLLVATLTGGMSVLTSCNEGNNGQSSISTPSTPSSSDSSTSTTSDYVNLEMSKISTIYQENTKGNKYKIKGRIAEFYHEKQAARQGFLLFDDSDTIYVHAGSVDISTLKKGMELTIGGDYDCWISSREQESAAKVGYTGARQLGLKEIISITEETDTSNKEIIPESLITKSSVRDLSDTPVSTNITGKVFQIDTYLYQSGEGSNASLHFKDASKDFSSDLYAYNNNYFGQYDRYKDNLESYVSINVMVMNAKMGNGNIWRLLPLNIIKTHDKAEYDVKTVSYLASNIFEETYYSAVDVRLPKVFDHYEDYLVEYSVTESTVTIADDSTNPSKYARMTYDGSANLENVKVTIKIKSKDGTTELGSSEATINFNKDPKVFADAKTVSDTIKVSWSADNKPQVQTKGTILQYLYASPDNFEGVVLYDETTKETINVVFDKTVPVNVYSLELGNTIVVTGERSDYNCAKQVYNATLDFNYFNKTTFDYAAVTDTITVENLLKSDYTTTEGNLVGHIYKMKVMIKYEEARAGYFMYYVYDSNEGTIVSETVKIKTYTSDKTSAQYDFLKPYLDKEVEIIAMARHAKKANGVVTPDILVIGVITDSGLISE